MSGENERTLCEYNEFRRPRYFHGMLLEERDFQDEQSYHAAKRRMLNRTLHGSGIVCGLELRAKPESKEIEITSGLALDCAGNEIWVDKDRRFDLKKLLRTESPKDKQDCPPADDGTTKNYRWVGIRYREEGADPESVYLPGGGCEQRTCEYSRTREGYCMQLVKCRQESAEDGLLKQFCECLKGEGGEVKPKTKCINCEGLEGGKLCACMRLQEFCEGSVPCPDCGRCDEYDYVILGRIELDSKLESIVEVCMNDCRKYVLTGKLIQHLIVSTLAGAGENLGGKSPDVPLPDAVQIAQNPIFALCWYLRYFFIERATWELKECGPPTARPGGTVTQEQFTKTLDAQKEQQKAETTSQIQKVTKRFDERVAKLSEEHKQETAKQVNELTKDFEERLTALEAKPQQ
jgi:hypothetical protein